MNTLEFDIMIIGGGINGTGIARDAIGRGFKVALCEKDDIASATSSSSTKLIHGGLRYLEHYQFNFVRSALKEREVLMASAPHLISPLKFILPHNPSGRPHWLITLGLFIYDNLGGRVKLPKSGSINLHDSPYGHSLQKSISKGSYYFDCWVDDARLTLLNGRDAFEKGAHIMTHTECIKATPKTTTQGWDITLKDHRTGQTFTATSKIIVNATGPWAAHFLRDVTDQTQPASMRLVRGSHVVVKKLFDHDSAYILQNPDQRIMFAIPYENDFTLLGTTDEDFKGDLNSPTASEGELDYICEATNSFFNQKISRDDIVWSFSGVRPLVGEDKDAKQVSRDYRLDVQKTHNGSIALSIFGGKITTFRKLAEESVTKICQLLDNNQPAWTRKVPLPGGNLGNLQIETFITSMQEKYAFLPPQLIKRYACAYGTRIAILLNQVTTLQDLGKEICPDLYECEVKYLCQYEWASTAQDILWRRTKLGLYADHHHTEHLERWVKEFTRETAA